MKRIRRRIKIVTITGILCVLWFPSAVLAQLNINAQNGQVWRIKNETGAMLGVPTANTSNDPSAFDGEGYGIMSLRLGSTGALFTPDSFGLALDGTGRRIDSTTAWTTASVQNLQAGDGISGLSVTRRLDAPAGTNYIRYIDSFSNSSGSTLTNLQVGFGAMTQQFRSNAYDTTYGTWGETMQRLLPQLLPVVPV